MRLLIAGGSGFIGKNFLLRAHARFECFATYCQSADFPAFLAGHGMSDVHAIRVDMEDPTSVAEAFASAPEQFDACLYAMGNSDIGLARRQPLIDVRSNLHSLLNLLGRIRVGKFVFMSSGAVYEGHNGLVHPGLPVAPTIPYSVDKLASELFIRYYQQHTERVESYVNLRFFGADGPMEASRKIYTKLVKTLAIEEQDTFRLLGSGRNLIDAMYIDDAVTALEKVVVSDKGNATVDLCRGRPLTVNELVCEVGRVFGRNVAIEHEGKAAEYTTFYASPDEMDAIFDFRSATSLKDGLTAFAQHLRKHPPTG